jgi:hypothetical protein
MNARARLSTRHLADVRQLAAEADAPDGLTADAVREEARAFLAWPPEVQRHELEAREGHDEV